MAELSSAPRPARLAAAIAALREGAAAAAEAMLRAMLAEDPRDAVVLCNLGVAMDAQGRLREAADCYRQAALLAPGHVQAQYNLGMVLLKLGAPAAAADHLRRASALAAQAGGGAAGVRANAALARLAAAARLSDPSPSPQDPLAALLAEAADLRARGLAEAAIDRLHRARALAPADGPIAYQAGELCVWNGRLVEARESLAVAMRWMAAVWQPTASPPATARFDRTAARGALFDVLDAMAAIGQPCFLNGGTLLGCVREGDFISFDSDIDVGVPPGTDPAAVIAAVDAHPALTFLYHDVHRDAVLRVRFGSVGGVSGDIFLYQQDREGLWCGVQRGSLALRWRDSPFGLRAMSFLGRAVLVPDPPERYLVENYGAWQQPDPDHIPGFSAPNLMDPDSDLSRCTLYLSLIAAMGRGHAGQAARYCRQARRRFADDALLAETEAAIAARLA
jgi:Flp pilus assembly protein TadD